MTDDIVKRAAEALEGVTLHLDHDGYFCARGPSDCAVVLVAYPVRDDSGDLWQPHACNAMIERFNAYPAMAADITALRAEVERWRDGWRLAERRLQDAEVYLARLRVERDAAMMTGHDLAKEEYRDKLQAAEAEEDRLREALAFYANPKNYEWTSTVRDCGCCSDTFQPVIEDGGQRARAAFTTKGDTK